jgi:hypothetical protein
MLRGADALLLLTEWNEYRDLDWKRIHRQEEISPWPQVD